MTPALKKHPWKIQKHPWTLLCTMLSAEMKYLNFMNYIEGILYVDSIAIYIPLIVLVVNIEHVFSQLHCRCM